MTCINHTHCAYDGHEDDRCPVCHCTWEYIARPATKTVITKRRNREGVLIYTPEIRHLFGYGELPLNHIWRHAREHKNDDLKATRKTVKQGADHE